MRPACGLEAVSRRARSCSWLWVGSLPPDRSPRPTPSAGRLAAPRPRYSPQEIRHAYGVDQLINRGDDGRRPVDRDLRLLREPDDRVRPAGRSTPGTACPNPPSFRILSPLGTVPFDPTDDTPIRPGWAAETTLDVEWAHAMAPEASIVLLTSPVDETEGVGGHAAVRRPGATTRSTITSGTSSPRAGAPPRTGCSPAAANRAANRSSASSIESYARAAAMGVTAIASTGDAGTANLENDVSTIFPFATVNFPASSPLVAAIGGTSLFADTSGDYQSETGWNEGVAATGGGISQQFREPFYEAFLPRSVQQELGGKRGLPDVSWNADPRTSIEIYISVPGIRVGYHNIGGTSEGSPSWAGVVADLDQLAGHGIGLLDPYAYALGYSGRGFHDVTVGNNSIDGIPGYSATPGSVLGRQPGHAELLAVVRRLRRLRLAGPGRPLDARSRRSRARVGQTQSPRGGVPARQRPLLGGQPRRAASRLLGRSPRGSSGAIGTPRGSRSRTVRALPRRRSDHPCRPC